MISRKQLTCLAALVLGDVLLAAACFGSLPARSPIHWNIRGEVDGYGSPSEVAFLFPVILVAMAGLLWGVTKIPQVGTALARSGPIYGRMVIASLGAMIGIHVLMLLAAFDRQIDVSLWLSIIIGLLLAVLGNWMGKLRRNQVAGIRAPWTLRSDVVWERTHRLGGRLLAAIGLAIVVAAICFPIWVVVAVAVGGTIALVIWAFAYSWWIYRALGEEKHLV
jgi:uncharacterized membrane protein